MARKSTSVVGVLVLLVAGLLCGEEGFEPGFQGVAAQAQAPESSSDDGKEFLDGKENDVKAIAASATVNNNNCAGLANCSSSCSRAVCHPDGNRNHVSTCTAVDNNEYFSLCSSSACQNKVKLDYTRSFLTLPAPGYTTNVQAEVATGICLQRLLDPTFMNVSVPSAYTLVYFGGIDGSFRAFPGREQNGTQCTTFDPRRRPWFVNGVSVHKDVKILLDVSAAMGAPVPVQYSQNGPATFLNVTQNITRALLQTFAPGDYVEVLQFDSQGATSLTNGVPVPISSSFDYKTADRPELSALIASVNNLVASQPVLPANLTGAIAKATSSFNAAVFSKVIIVLSIGDFATIDSAFPQQKLLSSQTKLMIFRLPPNLQNDTNLYLLTTNLSKAVCSVNGSFEVLDPLATANPLYSVRSYFTFLAKTQLVAAQNQPTWSYKYASVSQALNAITVTYPAFGDDGQLIGMAGVDVVVDSLSNKTLQGQLLNDFQNRNQGSLPVPANIPMACSYQTEDAVGHCSNSTPADSSAICLDSSKPITLASIACCGDCGKGKPGGLSGGAIAGIVIGGALLAVVVGICLYCCCKKRVPIRRAIDIHGDFPGRGEE